MCCRLLAAGLALVCAFPLHADPKANEPAKAEKSFEVPYRLTGTQHVLVRVKLNGKGPFNFILDTGAPALIINETIVKKTDAKLDGKGWGSFKLDVEGGVTLPEAKGLATDMFQLRGMNALGVAGAELHGVIGYNVLAKYRITYDFTSDKLIWTPINFNPPEIIRIGKGDSQGGLEIIGDMMKFLAPLLGIKPNFQIKPRGLLGLTVEERKGSVFVTGVMRESAAEKAGIRIGDRLEHIGRNSVDGLHDLYSAVEKLGEGEKLFLRIQRGGEKKDFTIELGKGL